MNPREDKAIAGMAPAEKTDAGSADIIKDQVPAQTDDTKQKLRDANAGTGPPSTEHDEGAGGEDRDGHDGGGAGSGDNRPKLPRPTGIQPCPRCGSQETKFCYYNNYNIKQPRYYCRTCQRYWTAGGALRDVPVGAGRRKMKGTKSQDDTLSGGAGGPGLSAVSLPALGLLPVAVDRLTHVIPTMLPPGIIPSVAFPPPEMAIYPQVAGESLAKVTANALLTDPAAAYFIPPHAHGHPLHPAGATRTTTVNQQPGRSDEPTSEDGTVDGRRIKRKVEKGEEGPPGVVAPGLAAISAAAAAVVPGRPLSSGGGVSVPASIPGVMPMAAMPPYSMDWFAAQQNPQAAAAMQAQFQAAAAAGFPTPFSMPSMWSYGYGGFPHTGWPTAAAFPPGRYPPGALNPPESGVMQPKLPPGGLVGVATTLSGDDGKPDRQEIMAGIAPPVGHFSSAPVVPPPVVAWPGAQWGGVPMPPMAMTMPYAVPAVPMPGAVPVVPGVYPPHAMPGLPVQGVATADGLTSGATTAAGPAKNGNGTSV